MMDFNLILLIVGLVFLAFIAISVLVGSIAGLKKELKCTAITFVVLIIALLVFGNPSAVLNTDGSMLKGMLQGIPDSAKTIWDVIVSLAQAYVPGGADIFVEGTESYAFLYAFVGGLVRAVQIIVGIIVTGLLLIIVNSLYRIISRIVAHNKAKKALKLNGEKPVEVTPEETPKVVNKKVVVVKNEDKAKGLVITTNKEFVPKKKHSHLWGGVLAFVKSIAIIFIIMTPISGLMSVVEHIEPETIDLIEDVMYGGAQQTNDVETPLDMVIDLKEAYYNSALGGVTEFTAYFFEDSVSTKMFDNLFSVKLQGERITLRQELVNIVEAVNALEGNSDYANLTDEQVSNAIDELKKTKFLPAVMPVAIEVIYYFELNGAQIKDYLFEAKQDAAFLNLRNADWQKDLGVILDSVKEFYKLGFLKSDFNYLAMDADALKAGLEKLGEAEALTKILNIAIVTAVNLDIVEEKLGAFDTEIDLTGFDWKKELGSIGDIYAEFLKLGIDTLEGLDINVLIPELLDDEAKVDAICNIVNIVVGLQLVDKVALELGANYLETIPTIQDNLGDYIEDLHEIVKALPADVPHYLEGLTKLLPSLDFSEGLVPKVDYLNIDVVALYGLVDELFKTESFPKILPIAAHVGLNLPAVKDLTGDYDVKIAPEKIDWKKDFTTLIDIYAEVQKLEIADLNEVTADIMAFLSSVAADDAKMKVLENVVTKLTELGVFEHVVAPLAGPAVNTFLKKSEFARFADILTLDLTMEEWKNDLVSIVSILTDVNDICGFKFALDAIDFTEDGMTSAGKVLEKVFALNLLGDDNAKNTLVKNALLQFELFAEEDVEAIDLSGVVWNGPDSEVEVLKNILLQVSKLNEYEGLDLNTLTYDVETLLSDDAFIDEVVNTLEYLVDSNLILEILPAALNKFVVPMLEDYDDEDGTLKDIITGMDSEELINEVLSLVDAVKAAIDLGVLNVSKEGLQALDLTQTEALKDIINTIFDSKLIEGREGRIIRIILKAAKLFEDIEKDALVNIDYDREQALLNQAIDELAVVLKDEEFKLFDEEGKISLQKEYLAKTETLNALFSALSALFGEYTEEYETKGSELVEVLLPEAYQKYISGMIPEQFIEAIEITGLDKADGDFLLSDVRHILHVVKILIDINVQSFVLENDYDFSDAFEGISKILDTVFSMNSIEGKESELVAWGLNFAADTFELDHEFTVNDFAGVDWKQEVEGLKVVIKDIIEFAKLNVLSTVNNLKEAISTFNLKDSRYITADNANRIIALLNHVLDIRTIGVVLPAAIDFVLPKLVDVLDVTFLSDGYTSDLVIEDLRSILDIVGIAVNDLQLVELYMADFNGNIPQEEPILNMLDKLFGLNILADHKLEKVIEVAVEKFLPANDFIKASDFDFDTYVFANDLEALKNVIGVAYDVLAENSIVTIGDALAFINESKYLTKTFARYENIHLVAELVDAIKDINLLQQAIHGVVSNVSTSDLISAYGDFSFLADYDEAMIANDIHVIAQIIDKAGLANIQQLYNEGTLSPIDYDGFAAIVKELGNLALLNNLGADILVEGVNYVLANMLKIDQRLTKADTQSINFKKEFETISTIVSTAGNLLKQNNLYSLNDVLQFISNSDYLAVDILLTQENLELVIDILDTVTNSQILTAVSIVGLGFGLDYANNLGYEVSFLADDMTGALLMEDIKAIVEIARIVVEDADILTFLHSNFQGTIPSEEHVVAILDNLFGMNLLDNGKIEKLLDFAVNKFMPENNFIKASDLDFVNYSFAEDYEVLKDIIGTAYDALKINEFDTVNAIMTFINNQGYFDKQFASDYNVSFVADLVRELSQLNILQQAIHGVVSNIVETDLVKPYGDFTFLKAYNEEMIANDIAVLSTIISKAQLANLVDYYTLGDINPLDLDKVADIIDEFANFKLVSDFGNELAAEGLTLVISSYVKRSAKYSALDFEGVNPGDEFIKLGNIVRSLGDLLENVELTSVSSIMDFINTQGYLDYNPLITADNANVIIDVLDTVFSFKVLEVLAPVGLELGVNTVNSMGYDIRFLNDGMTKEMIMEDLNAIVDALDILVNDIKAIDIYKDGYKGELPSQVVVESFLGKFLNMNLLADGKIEKLLEFAVGTFLPTNNFIKASDLDFANYSFNADKEEVKDLLTVAYNFLAANELDTIEGILAFVNGYKFLTKSFICYENINYVSQLIDELKDINILLQAVHGVVSNVVTSDMLASFGDFSFLTEYNEELIANDLHTIAQLIDKAGLANLHQFVNEGDLDPILFNEAGDLVAELGNLHLLKFFGKDLLVEGINYVLANMLNSTDRISLADVADVKLNEEFVQLGNVVKSLGKLLENNNLVTASSIMKFIFNGEYMLLDALATEENAYLALDVLYEVADLKLVGLAGVVGLGVGLDMAEKSGYDLHFLADGVTVAMINEDVLTLIDILESIVTDVKIFDLMASNFQGNIPSEQVVTSILDQLFGLNLLDNGKTEKLLEFAVNNFLPANDFIKAEDFNFDGYSFAADYDVLKDIIGTVYDALAHNGFATIGDVMAFVNNAGYMDGKFVDDYNVSYVSDILRHLSNFNLVLQAAHGVVTNVTKSDMVAKFGDFSFLANYDEKLIAEDLINLTTIIAQVQLGDFLDILSKGNIDPIHYDVAGEIVESLGSLRLIKDFGSQIVPVAFNYVIENMLNGTGEFTKDDFADYDWQVEFKELGDVVVALGALANANGFTSYQAIMDFINTQGYTQYNDYITTDNANLLIDVLNEVLDSRLVSAGLFVGAAYALDLAAKSGFEVSFLLDGMTADKLVEDVLSIVDILVILVNDVKVVDAYLASFDVDVPQEQHIIDVLDKLFALNLLADGKTEKLLDYAVNKFLPANDFVKADDFDFDNYVFADDYAVLKDIIGIVYDLLAYNNLSTVKKVMNFVLDMKFLSKEVIDDTNAKFVSDIIRKVSDLDIVLQAAHGAVSNVSTSDMLAKYGDFSFLVDYDKASISADLKVIANVVDRVVLADALVYFNEGDIDPISYPNVANVVKEIGKLQLLAKFGDQLLPIGMNYVVDLLKLEGVSEFTQADFVGINFVSEFDIIGDTVKLLGEFLTEKDLVSVSKIMNFINTNGFLQEDFYLDVATYEGVQPAINKLVTSEIVKKALVIGVNFGIKMGKDAGYDVSMIAEGLTGEMIAQDIITLVNDVIYAFKSNAVHFAIKGQEIKELSDLQVVVIDLFSLNILSDGRLADIIKVVCAKFDINVPDGTFDSADWLEEAKTINAILEQVYGLMNVTGRTTLDKLVALGTEINQYLAFSPSTNSYLAYIANIVEEASKLQLLKGLALPAAESLVTDESLQGLADLQNIYTSGEQLSSDIVKLANVIRAAINLDLYKILTGEKDLPYGDKESINAIISNVTSLAYVNNAGRIETLVKKFVPQYDLSGIDYSNINLALDGNRLVNIYDELSNILTDEGFPYNNIKDNYIRINLNYWAQDKYLAHVKTALDGIINLSVVTETKGAILVVIALPILKGALPEIYEALDLDNITADRIGNDFDAIIDLVQSALSLDLVSVLKGEVFTYQVEVFAGLLVETVFGLEIIKGHEGALVKAILEKFDGTDLGFAKLDASIFNFDNFDAEHDAQILKAIITNVCEIARSENVINYKDVKPYFEKVKTNINAPLSNDELLANVIDIYNNVLELTILADNFLVAYNEYVYPLVKDVDAQLTDISSVYADDAEFIADLKVIGTILEKVRLFGFASIVKGEPINYDQVDLMRSIAADVASIKLINEKLEALVDFADKKVTAVDLSKLDLSEFDLANDLDVIVSAYAELLPLVKDAKFPYKVLNDIATPITVDLIKQLAYDHQLEIVAVIDTIKDLTILPAAVDFAYDTYASKIPAKFKPLVDVLDIPGMTNEELKENVHTLSLIFNEARLADALNYVLFKNDVALTSDENYVNAIDYILSLTFVEKHFNQLLEVALNEYANIVIDAKDVSLQTEKDVLAKVIRQAFELLIHNKVDSYEDVIKFVKEFETKALIGMLAEDYGLNKVALIIEALVNSSIVNNHALEVVKAKVQPLADKHPQFASVLSLLLYTNETFVEDLMSVAQIVKELANTNLNEAYLDQDLAIDYANAGIASIIEILLNTHLVEYYGADLIVETVTDLAKDKVSLDALDRSELDFAHDAPYISGVYSALVPVLESTKWPLKSFNDFKAIFKGGKLELPSSITNYDYVTKAVEALRSLEGSTLSGEIYAVLFDNAKMKLKGSDDIFDISMMTRAEMKADFVNLINVVEKAVIAAYNEGANNPVVEKDVELVNGQLLKDVITSIYGIESLKDNYDEIIYYALDKLKVKSTSLDLYDIDYAVEFDVLGDVVIEVVDLLKANDLASVKLIMSFVKDGKYKDYKPLVTRENIELVKDVVSVAFASEVIEQLVKVGVEFGLEKAEKAGYDLTFITDELTTQQICEDILSLLEVALYADDANVFGYVLKGEMLASDTTGIKEALKVAFAMNIFADGRFSKVVSNVGAKHGVIVSADKFKDTDLVAEADVLYDLFLEVNELLQATDRMTFAKAKALVNEYKDYLKLNDEAYKYLPIVADILDVVSRSEIILGLAFPLSYKFTETDKLDGLLDLHDIYQNEAQLSEDLIKVADLIRIAVELDAINVYKGTKDLPFGKKAEIENAIIIATSLHYVNNDGRLETLLAKATKKDLSDLDFTNVDIASDGIKLAQMYEVLSVILTDSRFPIKNIKDRDIAIKLADWFSEPFKSTTIDALDILVDTTLVKETKGAILVLFALPVIKDKLPEIYEALDLENVTAERVGDDFDQLVEFIKFCAEKDLISILERKVITNDVESIVVEAIDTFFNLNIIKDHEPALVKALIKKLDGKKIGKATFNSADFNFDNFNATADVLTLQSLVHNAFDVARCEGLITIADIKSYISSFNVKSFLKNKEALIYALDAYEDALDLTLLEGNWMTAYNAFVLPMLGGNIQSLATIDGVYANDAEFVVDLRVVSSVAHKALDLGMCEVFNGALINYDQPALVKALLNEVATIKLVEAKLSEIVEFVDGKVSFIDASSMNLDNMDIANDFAVLGEVYEALIPVFLDANFPIKTIGDRKNKITLSVIKQLVYNNQSAVANMVEEIAELSILKEVVDCAYDSFIGKVPAKLLPYINALAIKELTEAELKADVIQSAQILRDIAAVDALSFVLFRNDVSFTSSSSSDYEAIVEDVFALNMVAKEFNTLVDLAIKDVMKVDIDETSVVMATEKDVIKAVIAPVFALLTRNDIDSYRDVISYIKNIKVKETIVKFAEDEDLQDISTILSEVANSTIVANGGLLIAQSKLQRMTNKFPEFANVFALLAYTNETFVEDIDAVATLIAQVAQSNLNEALLDRSIEIDYANVAIEEMIKTVFTMNFVEYYLADAIAAVQDKLNKDIVDFEVFDATNVDFEADADQVVNAYKALLPVLTSNSWTIKTVTDAVSVVKTGKIKVRKSLSAYDYVSCIVDSLEALNGSTLSGELLAVICATLPMHVKGTEDIFTLVGVSRPEMIADYANLMGVLDALVEVAYNGGLNNPVTEKDIQIVNSALVCDLIDAVAQVKFLEDNYDEIVFFALDKLKVDSSSVALDSSEILAEFDTYKAIVEDAYIVLNSLGVTSVKGIMPYVREILPLVKADVRNAINAAKAKDVKGAFKAIIKTAKQELVALDLEAFVSLFEDIAQSAVIAELIIPVYNDKVLTRLPSRVQNYVDLNGYTSAELQADLGHISVALRDVYESKVYDLAKRQVADVAGIPLVENAVRELASLNILTHKYGGLETVVNKALSVLKVNTVDASMVNYGNIDLAADKDIYASMVTDVYTLCNTIITNGLKVNLLGNTTFASAFVSLYDKMIQTNVVNEFTPIAIAIVNEKVARTKMKLSTNSTYVLQATNDILHNMLEIGVFSNNGIDFTKVAEARAIIDDIQGLVNFTSRLDRYIDRVKQDIDAYGVVPFSWEYVSVRAEYRALRSIYSQARSFVGNYASSIKGMNLSFLATTSAQQELTNIVSTLKQSNVLSQLVIPMGKGTFNVLTRSFSSTDMVYDGTLDDIINESLPNIYDLVELVDAICGWNFKAIDKTAFGEIAQVLRIVAKEELFKDNLAKVAKLAMDKVIKKSFTVDEYLLLESCNLTNDIEIVAQALENLEAVKASHPFAINLDAFKDQVVADALADAVDAVLTTTVCEKFVRRLANVTVKVINGVSVSIADMMKDRLDDADYTDALLLDDMAVLSSIIRIVPQTNVLGHTSDYSVWNLDALEDIVDIVFATNFIVGNEKVFFDFLINRVPVVESYYDDSIVITDYKAEIKAMLEAINVFNALDIDMNNIGSLLDVITGAQVYTITQSQIVKKVFVDEFNKVTTEYGLEPITDAKINEINADPNHDALWDNELEAIKALKDALQNKPAMNAKTISDAYFNSILVKYVMDNSAQAVIESVPAVSEFYAGFTGDYANELFIIMSALRTMGDCTVSELDSVYESSHFNGNTVMELLKSDVMKNKFIVEVNDLLNTDIYKLQVSDLDLVTTAAGWDKELEALSSVNEFSTGSLTNSTICNLYNNTVLVKHIIIKSAPSIIAKIPVVGEQYDGMTTGWTDAEWEAELDIIVDAFAIIGDETPDFNDPLGADISAELIYCVAQSDVLAASLAKNINDALVGATLPANILTKEDIQAISESQWANEKTYANLLISASKNECSLTASDVEEMYNNNGIARIILVKGGSQIITSVDGLGAYYNAADVENWDKEIGILISVSNLLTSKGLTDLSDPVSKLDGCGDIIVEAFESQVLKAAFIGALEDELAGVFGPVTISESLVDSVTVGCTTQAEKVAAWNNEIAELNEAITVAQTNDAIQIALFVATTTSKIAKYVMNGAH